MTFTHPRRPDMLRYRPGSQSYFLRDDGVDRTKGKGVIQRRSNRPPAARTRRLCGQHGDVPRTERRAVDRIGEGVLFGKVWSQNHAVREREGALPQASGGLNR